jgi:hypothetical protein
MSLREESLLCAIEICGQLISEFVYSNNISTKEFDGVSQSDLDKS